MREIPIFRNLQLFDAHISVLFDQRLSLGTLRPYKRRMNKYCPLMGHIFGNTPLTGWKRVESVRDNWKRGKLPSEMLLLLLTIQHFKETTSAVQMVEDNDGGKGLEEAVVAAQTPVVLVGAYDALGEVQKYHIFVSGDEAFTCRDGQEALYLFLAAFYAFHISPVGTAQERTGDLEFLPTIQPQGDDSEDYVEAQEESGPEEEKCEPEAKEEDDVKEVARLGQSNIVTKRKGDVKKDAEKRKKRRKCSWKKIKEKQQREDAYDLSMTVHVLGKVLLNISNSYSSTLSRNTVQSGKLLENRFWKFGSLASNVQEKNATCEVKSNVTYE